MPIISIMYYSIIFNIIAGIYFDGKEGDSLHHTDGKNLMSRDEMYTLVGYPGEKSLGSCFMENGTGILIGAY